MSNMFVLMGRGTSIIIDYWQARQLYLAGKKHILFFPNLTIVPSKPLIVASAMYALRFPLQEIDAHRVTVAEQEHPPHPLCTMLTPPVVFTQVCFCAREGYCMQIIVLTKEVG